MSKPIQKCTQPKHKWIQIRTVTVKRQTGLKIRFTLHGEYKCQHCGAIKMGAYR